MSQIDRPHEFRCPIHGFIKLSDWEREIVAHPAFQRLRRIRQLGWTDYVYPGAMHTRFEHSLGVMHVATLLYESIVNQSRDLLKSELDYNEIGIGRGLQLVRLAALLHDVGHGPFSHVAEDVMPPNDAGGYHKHEEYSAEIIRTELRDVIDNHPVNKANDNLSADDVAGLIEGKSASAHALFWRDLINSQLDADRMDYLLRDSHHVGVRYGQFDLHRLVSTIIAVPTTDATSRTGLRLGVTDGGWHAVESLLIARYLMFTQVYFHKTRVAYDIHVREALKMILPSGHFPTPSSIKDYLSWDDWRVLGELASGEGGEHADRLRARHHYRQVFHTEEAEDLASELARVEKAKTALGALLASETSAKSSWYKTGLPDIPVLSDASKGTTRPLSNYSPIVANMKQINQVLLYVRPEHVTEAKAKLSNLGE